MFIARSFLIVLFSFLIPVLSVWPHLLVTLMAAVVHIRIRFKLSTLTFKALHTGRPKYLADLLHLHKPTRSMRSPYTQLLTLPRHNLSFGSRTFRISAPKNWNILPLEVCQSHSLFTFRKRLKTILFLISLSVLLAVTNAPSRLQCYINHLFTYLLTCMCGLTIDLVINTCTLESGDACCRH